MRLWDTRAMAMALAPARPVIRAILSAREKCTIDAMTRRSVLEVFAVGLPCFAQDDPGRDLWIAMRRELTSPTGEKYFETSLKGSQLPWLKGTLISAEPSENFGRLLLGMADAASPEVTLVLTNGRGDEVKLEGKPKLGTTIAFQGVGFAFVKDPFMLTFKVSVADGIRGLEFEK
jgi:hypothetical protein